MLRGEEPPGSTVPPASMRGPSSADSRASGPPSRNYSGFILANPVRSIALRFPRAEIAEEARRGKVQIAHITLFKPRNRRNLGDLRSPTRLETFRRFGERRNSYCSTLAGSCDCGPENRRQRPCRLLVRLSSLEAPVTSGLPTYRLFRTIPDSCCCGSLRWPKRIRRAQPWTVRVTEVEVKFAPHPAFGNMSEP